jgi:hypothetical protein
MKYRFCFLPIALAIVGCAHKEESDANFLRTERTRPPAFLKSAAALLLTNSDGFIGHVAVGAPSLSSLPEHASYAEDRVSGELFGRQGKLFFLPDETVKSKRPLNGGVSFIWDATQNKGFVLSEALQGYAPISSSTLFTNLLITNADTALTEKIAGQTCQRATALASAADGTTAAFEIWRAPESKGFPLRIVSTNPPGFDLHFAKMEPRTPSNEQFSIPPGFTKYESLEGMMNELVARQHDIRRTGTGALTIPQDWDEPKSRKGPPGTPNQP